MPYSFTGRRECHIPVQLQLAGDDEFLANSLRSHSGIGQVFVSDDSDTSSSDIDISALLESDQNSSPQPSASGTGARSHDLGQGPRSGGGSGKNLDTVSQNDINQIILSQLSALGDRLDKIEKVNKHELKNTGNSSKIKAPSKMGAKGKTTYSGFDRDVASASAWFDISPPDSL